jgi:NADPH-dependent curcumin reductase CurA
MTATVPAQGRAICLGSRPHGEPGAEHFEMRTIGLPPLGDGDVLVRNTLMSVEPYMRGRMNEGKSYVPPFEIGEPLSGAAIGTVIASNDPNVAVGAVVLHNDGWRDYAVVAGRNVRVIDGSLPPHTYLGALGTPGFTAWVGLRTIGRVTAGETLFVSAAAGAVGSMAVQLAKHWGLRVIGSAGSDAKADYVRETLGADAAFDYHAALREALSAAAPDGIDVYFDNVGGEQLEAAIDAMRPHGRAILCGAISQYNAQSPPAGPRNLSLAIGRRLRLEGFIILDHGASFADFSAEVTPLVRAGTIVTPATFVDGLENAPTALIDILRSNAHVGKVVVRLD